MSISIFWHRRDIRFHDNAGLYRALKSGHTVVPVFIFDKNILDSLPEDDSRVNFIHDHIIKLSKEYEEYGGRLHCYYGYPEEVWKQIIKDYDVCSVYTNKDYESYAISRDTKIKELLDSAKIEFKSYLFVSGTNVSICIFP